MKTTKIVYIGAGSMCFGLSLFKDIFTSKELNGSTLSLVDIDEENLERMYKLALKMNEASGIGLKIEKTLNRREVLSGAEFVVNSIAIERCALWKYDFEIPKKYGIRQTLGENGGPGGLFFSMRTIPLIMDIIRDMEELCPNAYFLNFSNPESRIILALGRYTKIKCVGLCHGVFMGRNDAARIMGLDPKNVDVLAAGLNHFQWLLEIKDKNTGEDLYPLFREKEKVYDKSFMPLSRKLFRTFGFYPTCSDDHLGEYVAYGWEGGEEGYDFEGDEKYRIFLRSEIEARINGTKLVEDWFEPSGEKAVEVITGILYNKKTYIDSGIVYNNGSIANLPKDLAVEVPIMVDTNGIHPCSIGNLPEGIAKLLTMQASVQQLAVDAAVNASKELALQALLVDPVVNSTEAADKILEELWEINNEYIKCCI
jgi:alpha-galactosidase